MLEWLHLYLSEDVFIASVSLNVIILLSTEFQLDSYVVIFFQAFNTFVSHCLLACTLLWIRVLSVSVNVVLLKETCLFPWRYLRI